MSAAPPILPQEFTHRQILVIFSGLMFGNTMAALDQTVVATAIPQITSELGGIERLAWVVTAYLLASTVATPVFGKLGDLYGRKRMFQTAIVVFLAGSIACGLAQSITQLIVFRAVQGLGGGAQIVLIHAIVADVVSPRNRGKYLGYLGATYGAASAAGPLVGGWLTDVLSWRWVFYVNVPVGGAALIVTSVVLPKSERRPHARIDYLGTLAITGAAASIILLATHASDTPRDYRVIGGLGVAAVIFVAALLFIEARAEEPILPLHLFSIPTFWTGVTVSFVIGLAMFSAMNFLPLFVQVAGGASATDSGILLLPLMAGLVLTSISVGRLVTRTGRYKLYPLVGTAVATVALALLGSMDQTTSRLTMSCYMVLLGFGIGATFGPLLIATQNAVAYRHLGTATASMSFFRALGGAIGVALFGAIFIADLSNRLSGLAVSIDPSDSIDLATINALSPLERGLFDHAFAASLTWAFTLAAPLGILAFVLVVRLRELPLGTTRAVLAAET